MKPFPFRSEQAFQRRPMVPPLPLSDARGKALLPSMEQVLLAGAGHELFVTRAAEVDRAALEFLVR